jgi:regulator of protease activity HflC (stomatin/prohibitin superfamily)
LKAEGEKQAAILRAEGEKSAQLLRAEGYQKALEAIFAAAKDIDQKTMTLQYFETLKSMAANPSTKYIFPMEFTSLISDFVNNNKAK